MANLEKMTRDELLKYAKENNISEVKSKMNKTEIIELINLKSKDIEKNNIENDLLDQLERNGVFGKYYIDLVKDYMAMWDVKNQLIKDIQEKGVSVTYQNGENQWGYKKNDSVGELNRTNNQMIKLLDALGLKANKIEIEPGNDDTEM